MVAPFDSSSTGNGELGKKVGIVLNLQVWQTLRIPPTGPGHSTQGGVTWDISSAPPTSYVEAEQLARAQIENPPQLVLWGKTWRYGKGNIVEAFLLVRDSAMRVRDQTGLWTVAVPGGPAFTIGIPRRQIEFAPIVLRADLLPELKDPAGLKLYNSPEGTEIRGFVGDYFLAREQSGDTALVELPNHERGWIRLPHLSTTHSELVDFSGALVRILRQDWNGAQQLFRRVVTHPSTPTAVRIDAYLYLAIAAANAGEDSYPWVKQAYELDPYSRTTIQFLACPSRTNEAKLDVDD